MPLEREREQECLPQAASSTYREEQHAELAAHLDALIDAHIELGRSPESAVQAALEQFGDASHLGRQLSRAWKRSAPAEVSTLKLSAVTLQFLTLVGLLGLNPDWPAILRPGPPVLGAILDLLVPCLAGFTWAHHRPTGCRWLFTVLLPVLLGPALLPFGIEGGLGNQELLGRVLLLCKWGSITCSAAGLTASLELLAERFQRRRAA